MVRFMIACLAYIVLAKAEFATAQTHPGMYVLCNGCSAMAMRNTAKGIGAGEHLVMDATGKHARIITVACGPYIDASNSGFSKSNENADGSVPSRNAGEVCWIEGDRWDPVDQATLDFIKDGLESDGSFAKDVEVSSSTSIYHVAMAPEYHLAPIRDSLWQNLLTYSPGGMTWNSVTSWGLSYYGFGDSSVIKVTIIFPDGSMEATIEMDWINSRFPILSEPRLSSIQLHLDTARDRDGNVVPNLSGPAEWFGNVQFTFLQSGSAPSEWNSLMSALGYEMSSSSGPGTAWICGTTTIPGQPATKVCAPSPH